MTRIVSNLRKRAAAQEREKIVAFLRQCEERTSNAAMGIAAQMIENGLHL
jgi:hypothetical protein